MATVERPTLQASTFNALKEYMALVIDSTDLAYITLVTTALNTLLGILGALDYTQQSYRTGGRYVIRVTEGAQINTAQAFRPHSTTLVRRVIASEHWTRIIYDHANDCSPDKWLKDKIWSGVKSLIPTVAPDAGFMRKVLTTGSSSVARWEGTDGSTANLSMMGTIRMAPVPSFILLAHELIHSDHIARGRLLTGMAPSTFLVDQRQKPDPLNPGTPTNLVNQPSFNQGQVVGGNVVKAGGAVSNVGQVVTAMPSGRVWVDGTMERTEEIATVGLSDDTNVVPVDALAITENMVRQEHGIAKRLKYGTFNKHLL
jgi:hypothetical protein